MKPNKILLLLLLSSSFILNAQTPDPNAWALQPWMEVEGNYSGQKLGSDVGFIGKLSDSTQICVSDVNSINMYRIKSPTDTIPRFLFKGSNCLFGDFNGDGIQDLVVGGNPTRIYLGKAPGVFDMAAFFTKYQEPNGNAFGKHIAVGKINGDKYDDLVVTDAGYPNDYLQGKVYIFFGGMKMDTIPKFSLLGDTILSGLGNNITLGDLNNDGYKDIIVRGLDMTKSSQNLRMPYIKIFLGGNTIDTAAWKYIKGSNNQFSGGLASFDVNGDGIDDLLWETLDSLSTVYIHYGGVGFDTIPNLKLKNPGIGGLGDVIVNGGDMNGDGYNDIVVGAPGNNQDFGAVLVYSGGPQIDGNFDAAATLSVESLFGYSISSVGDINGDGLSDIIVGAPDYEWYKSNGKWFILLGSKNISVTSVKGAKNIVPQNYMLFQNYPNPFNPTTTISYILSKPSMVLLSVYNVLGQKIKDLVNEKQSSGKHEILFDGSQLSSGTYFYKLTATDELGNSRSQTKQMILLK